MSKGRQGNQCSQEGLLLVVQAQSPTPGFAAEASIRRAQASQGRCPHLDVESPAPAITCSFLGIPYCWDSGTSPWEAGSTEAEAPS